VDVFYSRNPCEDHVENSVRQAIQIHLQAPEGEIDCVWPCLPLTSINALMFSKLAHMHSQLP
jgi:hypothetical protein